MRGGFPGGPMVKIMPSSAEGAGSIPGQGTKIAHATGQLSPCVATREPTSRKLQSPCTLQPICQNYIAPVPMPQLMSLSATDKVHVPQ